MDTTTPLEFARGPTLDTAAVFVIGVVGRLLHLFLRPSTPDLSEPHIELIERHSGPHWPAVPGAVPRPAIRARGT
ncbi:MAG TPA: hypothetical protein VKT00_02545 [Casimicrobiaceae bacterium]|nr:hypothetical protein [Casimicrobiaceae bacterium]